MFVIPFEFQSAIGPGAGVEYLLDHEGPSAAEPQPNISEYLAQRREGRKGRSLGMKVIQKVTILLF
jgi:hypothetical protein